MLRAAKAPPQYILAAKHHRCEVCDSTKDPPRTNKVSPPKLFEFNYEVGIDVFEIKDAAGTFYDVLNIADYGTMFEQAAVVRVADRNGLPTSAACLHAFDHTWVRPFG